LRRLRLAAVVVGAPTPQSFTKTPTIFYTPRLPTAKKFTSFLLGRVVVVVVAQEDREDKAPVVAVVAAE
jgi:hypothetical protein